MNQNSIFEAITTDPVDLSQMILKSKLIAVIVDMIREKNWTQTVAATQLQISQPRVSNLFKGHLDKFSVDFLLETVYKLGYKLDLDYDPTDRKQPITMAIKRAAL